MVSQNTLRRYIVGAYATSPNLFTWDEKSELVYFNMLKELPLIKGLELPFWGDSLHPFDDDWLLSNLDPKWENVFTCVPGTMKYLESNSYFGLASKNTKSREEALRFYETAFDCIAKLKRRFGKNCVTAIYITSSPCQNDTKQFADTKHFQLSLLELSSWDWGNTKIIVEHCDAYTKINTRPQKGFLTLENEISAIKQANDKCGSNIGILINWGRSAIEDRNVNGPIRHIKYAVKNKVLSGLMFSGTTANDNNLYGAWSDLHMPPAPFADYQYFEPQSLMTYENIKKSLSECDMNALEYLGLKLLAMPKESTIEKRITINKNTMCILDHVINEIAIT